MLNRLSDADLILGLKRQVQGERTALVELLQYLEEVERRELHLARGFPSLFAFCVDFLGYSEGEAHVRIQAMRLTRSVPEAVAKIANGELSMTVAAKVQNCFRRAKKLDQPVPKEKKLEVVRTVLNLSTKDAERKLVSTFPEAGLPREHAKPISDEMTRIEFNANRQQLAKYEKLKSLLAHKNFEGRWDKLFEELADIALAKLSKKFGESAVQVDGVKIAAAVDQPGTANDAALLETTQVVERQIPPSGSSNKKPNRRIPSNVYRFVWDRDQGRCQFVDPLTGRRCESTHGLQCDHIIPFSHGGENVSTNLRLMCPAHNRYRAELL